MKTIIAGGKNYYFNYKDIEILDNLKHTISEVVSGGAKGADSEGEKWAIANNIPLKVFKADWSKYGRAAGPIRNKQMAEYADAVILFPGGSGTDNMYANAVKAGLKIYDYRSKNNFKEWLYLKEGFGFDWSKIPNVKRFIDNSAKSIDIKNRIADRVEYFWRGIIYSKPALSAILGRQATRKDFDILIKNIAIKNLKKGSLQANAISRAAASLEKMLNSFYKSYKQQQNDPNHQANAEQIADDVLNIYQQAIPFKNFSMVNSLINFDKEKGLLYFDEEDSPQDIFRLKPIFNRKKLSVMKNKHTKHGVDVTIYYAFELAPTNVSRTSQILSRISGEEPDTTPFRYEDPKGGFVIDPNGWQNDWMRINQEIKEKEKALNKLKNQKDPDSQDPYINVEKYYKNHYETIKQHADQILDGSYNLNTYFNNYIKIAEGYKLPTLTFPQFRMIIKYYEEIEPEIQKLQNDISVLKVRQKQLRKTKIKPTHANVPSKAMTSKNRRQGNINEFLTNAAKAFIKIMKKPVTESQKVNRLFFAEQSAKMYHNANPDKKIDIIIYPQSSSGLVKDITSEFAIIYRNAKIIEGFKKLPKEQISMDFEKAKRLGMSEKFMDNMKKAEELIKRSGDNKTLKGRNEQYRHYVKLYYNNIPKDMDLKDKNILVVDDIGTTGSTMQYIKEDLENYSPNSIEFYVPILSQF